MSESDKLGWTITKNIEITKSTIDTNNHRDNKTTLAHNEPIDVVHIGKNLKEDCSLHIQIGDRDHKTLWDLGAGHHVISLDQYHKIPDKFKTDLFESPIKIRAANMSEIDNQGGCDITFRIGQVTFTFPFLVSEALTQKIIWGYNFSTAFHIGTTWNKK